MCFVCKEGLFFCLSVCLSVFLPSFLSLLGVVQLHYTFKLESISSPVEGFYAFYPQLFLSICTKEGELWGNAALPNQEK